jgi:hypothetical protein
MLWCLDGQGMVLLTFDNVDFMMVPLLQTGCLSNGKQVFLEGGFTSAPQPPGSGLAATCVRRVYAAVCGR